MLLPKRDACRGRAPAAPLQRDRAGGVLLPGVACTRGVTTRQCSSAESKATPNCRGWACTANQHANWVVSAPSALDYPPLHGDGGSIEEWGVDARVGVHDEPAGQQQPADRSSDRNATQQDSQSTDYLTGTEHKRGDAKLAIAWRRPIARRVPYLCTRIQL